MISVLIKQFDIDVNILTANIESLQNTPYGTLLVELEGDEVHMKEALDYLQAKQQLKVEVIGYVS